MPRALEDGRRKLCTMQLHTRRIGRVKKAWVDSKCCFVSGVFFAWYCLKFGYGGGGVGYGNIGQGKVATRAAFGQVYGKVLCACGQVAQIGLPIKSYYGYGLPLRVVYLAACGRV